MPFTENDFKKIKGLSKEKILEFYLSFMSGSNEKKPDMKLVLLRVEKGYNPKDIRTSLDLLIDSKHMENQNFRSFIDEFSITIESEKDIYFLQFLDTYSNLNLYYTIFIDKTKSYWTVITIAKKNDLKRTLFRLINEIQELELIEITQNQLEELAQKDQNKDGLKGFTAKYIRENDDNEIRDLTFSVHGGSLNDLKRIRELFPVEPTIIKFRLSNSPEVCINAYINGYFAIPRLDKESRTYAAKIISIFQQHYFNTSKIYENVSNYQNKHSIIYTKDGQTLQAAGRILKSEYIIKMKIKEERFNSNIYDDYVTLDMLNANLHRFFKNYSKKYGFYYDDDYGYMIYDKSNKNHVQLTVEKDGDTYSIIIFPYGNCKPGTLEDLCTGISKRVESSFSEIKPMGFKY